MFLIKLFKTSLCTFTKSDIGTSLVSRFPSTISEEKYVCGMANWMMVLIAAHRVLHGKSLSAQHKHKHSETLTAAALSCLGGEE